MKKAAATTRKRTTARKATSKTEPSAGVKAPAAASASPAKKTTRRTAAKAKPKAAVALTATSEAPAPAAAPAATPPVTDWTERLDRLQATLLQELRGLREALVPASEPAGTDEVEAEVLSLRRLLGDLLERRTESLAARLAALRADLAAGPALDPAQVLGRLDQMLEELGAVRFEVPRLDFADPLICEVAEQRRDPAAPDGAVLETLRPGFRTARGRVLLKAAVAVNALHP